MIKIPKELVLNGTENDGYRHRYSLDKTESFKSGFINLMEVLEFEKSTIEKIKSKFVVRTDSKNEKGEYEEIMAYLKVSEIIDVCWYFYNKKYEVDVFFGSLKIILVIRVKSELRENLVKRIEEKSSWISEEEKERRLRKTKKRITEISAR